MDLFNIYNILFFIVVEELITACIASSDDGVKVDDAGVKVDGDGVN